MSYNYNGNARGNYFNYMGNDSLRAYGGDGRDTIYGNTQDDFISGDAGNDQLLGFRGDDHLVGGRGNDTLNGGDGNDRIDGYATSGRDYDSLYGGEGYDRFVLGGSWGVSYRGLGFATIKDWNAATDFIEVQGNTSRYQLRRENWAGSRAMDTAIYYRGDLIGVVQDTTNVQISRDFVSA